MTSMRSLRVVMSGPFPKHESVIFGTANPAEQSGIVDGTEHNTRTIRLYDLVWIQANIRPIETIGDSDEFPTRILRADVQHFITPRWKTGAAG